MSTLALATLPSAIEGTLAAFLKWLELNAILGAAFLGALAYISKAFLDNRRQAKAAVSISCCALGYLCERFEAAVEGKLKFALRGARTTEMIEAMRELEVASLPHEIIDAFAHVRSDIYAVNVRIGDVFLENKDEPSTCALLLDGRTWRAQRE